MAGNDGQTGGLEDQLRQMIISSGQNSPQSTRPTVRLPPRVPTSHENQATNRVLPPHARAAQAPVNMNPTTYDPSGPTVPSQQNGKGPRGQQRPNQKQRRMQPQPQPVQPHQYAARQQHAPYPHIQHGAYPQSLPRGPQLQQPPRIDPNAYQRGGHVAGYYQQPHPQPRQLYDPNMARGPPPMHQAQQHMLQAQYLDHLAAIEVSNVTMSSAEREEKEAFRLKLQQVVHEVCAADPDRLPKVSLEAFGSFQSGFANAGSDMDLVIVLPDGYPFEAGFGLMEDDLPRALEKRLLQLGFGARLLTRTRVPIIKICEAPNESLLDKLRDERYKWDVLDIEKKYPHLHPEESLAEDEEVAAPVAGAEEELASATQAALSVSGPEPAIEEEDGVESIIKKQLHRITGNGAAASIAVDLAPGTAKPAEANGTKSAVKEPDPTSVAPANSDAQLPATSAGTNGTAPATAHDGPPPLKAERRRPPRHDDRLWTRERKMGPLDFPKEGVGIQCDINFFNPLGLHNTQLLHCYALCDTRVTAMVLFVKAWAKRRKINSSYSGTLSSYGYVLMVLHYLVNVAQPPVLPNLQSPWRPNPEATHAGADRVECDGWVVDFWRNEEEILNAVKSGQMSTNRQSLGALLEGFFRYYSSIGGNPQFHWTQQVLTLRSPGGILSKEEKGWVKAVTQEGEGKKVQHRYLFCIEDPFELNHNVARTVTHPGIVAIRDEFRRARRILVAKGYEQTNSHDGELFDELVEFTSAPVLGEATVPPTGTVPAQNGGGGIVPNGARPASNAMGRIVGQQRAQARTQQTGARGAESKAINVADSDAFPTLGAAKAKPAMHKPKVDERDSGDMRVISGDRAKAYLEELRRKKAEADAEITAKSAAEAVLGGE